MVAACSAEAPFALETLGIGTLTATAHEPSRRTSRPDDLLERIARAPAIVSFTFDDAYRTQLTEAAPILAARGFPATEYVATFRIGAPPDEWGSPFMSWDDVHTLRDDYDWEIASHSVNHPLLDTLESLST